MKASAWAENDRIRAIGTRVLAEAAASASVETMLYPSVCLIYPDRGEEWIESDTPAEPRSRILESTVVAEREVAGFGSGGRRGIILRMGSFYGPDAPNTLEAVALARKGIAAVPGPASAYLSQIWVEDAAAAVVAAVDRAPSGIYNVVDDRPLQRREIVRAIAAAVGRNWLLAPPTWLVRLMGGRDALPLTRSQRVSNRRFRDATGWTPAVSDAHEGWARIQVAC